MKRVDRCFAGAGRRAPRRRASGRRAPKGQALLIGLVLSAALSLLACEEAAEPGLVPVSDLSPPRILKAEPQGARGFVLCFDEAVTPVPGSFGLAPGKAPSALADGAELKLDFADELTPGDEYRICGEVEDGRGNATRFFFSFCGYNERPARLRISELQTAKYSTKKTSHRDYIELETLSDGNLGGIELSWASSAKSYSYKFPGVEVPRGQFIVVHCAPENIAAERDERGADLALSGGIDASDTARDFWCGVGGLPDSKGVVVLRARSGEAASDCFFYGEENGEGSVDSDKLKPLLDAMKKIWPFAAKTPDWSDAFRAKSSNSRSFCRTSAADGGLGPFGPESWYLSRSGGQSPGLPNPGP